MSRGGQRREWTGEEEVPLPCLLPQADDLVTLNQPSILLGASPSVGQGQGSSTDPSYMLRPSWGAEAFTAHFSTEGKMDNAPIQGTKPLCSSGLHAVALEVLTCTLPAQQQSPRSGFPHALLSTCSPLLLLFFLPHLCVVSILHLLRNVWSLSVAQQGTCTVPHQPGEAADLYEPCRPFQHQLLTHLDLQPT